MAFRPFDFRRLACILETASSIPSSLQEARNRTAVSRYYYYIFLELREKIAHDLSPKERGTLYRMHQRTHWLISEVVYNMGLKEASERLRELRRCRNSSDYVLFGYEARKILASSKEHVNKLEQILLQQWETETVQTAFRKALAKIKQRRKCKQKK